MQPNDLLSTGDVCREEKGTISPDGVRKASDRGDLPIALRTGSGMRLFLRADVDQWRARRAEKSRRGR